MPRPRYLIGSFRSTVGEFLAKAGSKGWEFVVLLPEGGVQNLGIHPSQAAADIAILRRITGFLQWDCLDDDVARAQIAEEDRWRYFEISQQDSTGVWTPEPGERPLPRIPPAIPD